MKKVLFVTLCVLMSWAMACSDCATCCGDAKAVDCEIACSLNNAQ